MRVPLQRWRVWVVACGLLTGTACTDAVPTLSPPDIPSVSYKNEVPSEYEDILDEFSPSFLPTLHGTLQGDLVIGGGNWLSGPDKAEFRSKTYVDVGTRAWVIQNGSVEVVGSWTGEATLFCTGLDSCQKFAHGYGNCTNGIEWHAKVTHRFVFKFGSSQSIPDTEKYLWCQPSVSWTAGGGTSGCSEGGVWQQYFWYVDGQPILEWWELRCGYQT